MFDGVQEALVSAFGGHAWVAVIIVALTPMLELHTAIPFGMSTALWGDAALTAFQSFWWATLGSCVVVPIVLLLAMPILKWLKGTKTFRRLAEGFEDKLKRRKQALEAKGRHGLKARNPALREFLKIVGIAIYIALPLPFSGIYTGCFLALIMGLGFWKSFITITLGNVIAGLFMVAVCTAFSNAITFIVGACFVLMIAGVLLGIIKLVLKPKTALVDVMDNR